MVKCYYHHKKDAATQCSKCKRPLCAACTKKLKQPVLFILSKELDYCPSCFEKEVQKKIKRWREDMGYSENDYANKEDDFSY